MIGGQVVFTDTAPPNTAVSVYNGWELSGGLASLVDSYGRPAPNPVMTDGKGNLTFYAVPGDYLLQFVLGGATIDQQIELGQPVGATQTFYGGPWS